MEERAWWCGYITGVTSSPIEPGVSGPGADSGDPLSAFNHTFLMAKERLFVAHEGMEKDYSPQQAKAKSARMGTIECWT